jgi:CRISPR system Cascade subunit CasA
MNLINDSWIPVLRREDGKREYIRPFEITDALEKNPYLLLDAPRPDFNGALIQFLIGIIQTIMTAEDEEEWIDRFIKPPTTQELADAMQGITPFFNLDGNRPIFMQDYALTEGNEVDISGLFIESPGANTIKNNTDHFIKRAGIQKTCQACTATALFTLQTNAPAGGAGHRTSLRGGGPLTTLPQPNTRNQKCNTLWHRIWMGVLSKDELKSTGCNPTLKKQEVSFPWLINTRTSETKGSAVPGKEIHSNQIYWAMPRRILLQNPMPEAGRCDVCSRDGNSFYTSYITKNYGVEYGDGIVHPLSPYYQDKDSNLLPQHPQPGGFTYRHWPALLYSNTKENQRALVIRKAEERLKSLKQAKVEIGLGVYTFGYDMDNMKARCWYETQIPFSLVEKNREDFEAIAKSFAESARQIAGNTRQAVRNAWFSPDASVRGDFYFIESEFWQKTESIYLNALTRCAKESFTVGDEKYFSFAREWLSTLNRESLEIFDHYSEQVPMDQGKAGEPPRFLKARKDLRQFNYLNKIKEILHLPIPPKEIKKNKKENVHA